MRSIIVASIAALFMTFAVAGCKGKQEMKPPERVVAIMAANAVTRDMPQELDAIGQVEASATVSVRPLIGGLVQKVHFREGQDVRKGDMLVTIDPRPNEIAVQQAEAALARDIAQRDKAATDDLRYKTLLANGFVSQSDYDQAHVTLSTLDAAIKADQAAINLAKLNLTYCYIHAPESGRTGAQLVYEGTLLKASDDQAVVVIQSIEPVYVDFALPELYLATLRDRFKGGGLTVMAISTNGSFKPMAGKVTFLDNTVDRPTGTIKMKAMFQNSDRTLWPAQFVDISLTLSTIKDAVAVPSEAVQTGQKGEYVFVIKPTDMTAEMRQIKTGPSSGGMTAILSGVASGETVVTDGQLRLTPGVKVAFKNPNEAKPAAPADTYGGQQKLGGPAK